MFDQLPNEILFTVLMFLPEPADVLNFALTCMRFSIIAEDPYIRGKWQAMHLTASTCVKLYSRELADSFAAMQALRKNEQVWVVHWLRGIKAAAEEENRVLLGALLRSEVKIGRSSVGWKCTSPALNELTRKGYADELQAIFALLETLQPTGKIYRGNAHMLAELAARQNDLATLGVILDNKKKFSTWDNAKMVTAVFQVNPSLEMLQLVLSKPGPVLYTFFRLACKHGRLDFIQYMVEEKEYWPRFGQPRFQEELAKNDHVELMRYFLENTTVMDRLFIHCMSEEMFELAFSEFRHRWASDLSPDQMARCALVGCSVEKGWPLVKYIADRLVDSGDATLETVRGLLAEGFIRVSNPLHDPEMEYAREFAKEIQANWGADPQSVPKFSEVEEKLTWIVTRSGDLEILSAMLETSWFDPTPHIILYLLVQHQLPEAISMLLADPRVDPNANDGRAIKTAFSLSRRHLRVRSDQSMSYWIIATAKVIAADPRVDLAPYRDELLEQLELPTSWDVKEARAELKRILLAEE